MNQKYGFLRAGLAVMLALLVIQFVLGMYLNLFVELPKIHPGTTGSYAPSIPWALAGNAGVALALHVVVWILLSLGGIALLIRGIISRRPSLIVGTALGFLSILAAGSGGLGFLNHSDDLESFIMAGGFILALIAYGGTLYKARGIKEIS